MVEKCTFYLEMSLKRKLTQDDLRKAMSEHKKKLGVVKKIESPLARYPFYNILTQFEVRVCALLL